MTTWNLVLSLLSFSAVVMMEGLRNKHAVAAARAKRDLNEYRYWLEIQA
jgi:hypothetical protein